MKSKLMPFAAILVLGAMAMSSNGQTVVGSEDFESYPIGAWNASNAPAADPQFYGGVQSNGVNIIAAGDQELVVDGNLSNQYEAAVSFNLDMAGNVSRDIYDYELELYLKVDPSAWASFANGVYPLGVTLYNDADPLQGTDVPLSAAANYGDAVTNGAVLTIPLGPTNYPAYVPWDKQKHISADVSTWRIKISAATGGSLLTNDLPVIFTVDDVVVRYIEPPMVNPTGAPMGYHPTTNVTLTGTVYDGAVEVDLMELYLDGAIVATNSFLGGSSTNTISYNAVLDSGFHSAAVQAFDSTGTNTVWYEWDFYCAGTPASPSDTPLALYNFNSAGSDNAGFSKSAFPVTNALIAAAPSLGSNNWYNAITPNPWYIGDSYWDDCNEASGSGSWSNITVATVFASSSDGTFAYVPYTWGSDVETFCFAATNSIWGGAMGARGYNGVIEIRNLASDLTYDLYLYYVSPNETTSTVSYALSTGYAAVMEKQMESAQSSVYNGSISNNYVEGTNYVVLTDISPVGGIIGLDITGDAAGGGLSAFQLVVRKPELTVVPNVQSLTMSNNMVNLSWDSQKYISYNVLGKQKLTDASWTTVTNIPGSVGATEISVPASSQGFFLIEGY